MREQADFVARFADRRNVSVSRLDLDDDDPMAAGHALIGLAGQRQPDSLALNLTGGTKLMALGALEGARAADIPAYYMDTDRGRCLLLSGPHVQSVALPEVCRVTDILEANGYGVLSKDTTPVPADIRTLTRKLVDGFGRISRVIPAFNAMAQEASQTVGYVLERRGWPTTEAFAELLVLFADVGMLTLGQDMVRFISSEACYFAGGGWLEAHVKAILHRLRANGRIHDHAVNVVAQNAKGVKNELDAALVSGNRLFVMECKTARMSAEERDADVSYKLDTLRDVLGGAMTRAMLVSYLPLSEARRRRCREYRIQVVAGGDIKHLEEKITQWISSSAARRPRS